MAPSRTSRRNKGIAQSHEDVSKSATRIEVSQQEEQEEQEQHEEQEEQEEPSGELTTGHLIRILSKIGETQTQLLKAVKELKSHAHASKPNTERNDEREKVSQEESVIPKGPGQKGPSFVTQEDVVAMLEKELHRTNEDWKYPPYPSSLVSLPYPKRYEAPTFILFDGRKGSPKEHISRFIDALGPHAGDHNLRLREFLKSLTDRAYTWYTTLAAGSVRTWEELASKFCKKYFEHEERVTITQLNYTRQRAGENLVDFVCRFRDLALDCYDEKGEESLVEICISNMLPEYRVYLENVGIGQFSGLMDATKKTSMSVKAQRSWRSDKKDSPQTLAIEEGSSYKKKRETFPAIPCSNEEFHAILDTMFADGVIKLPRPQRPPSKEEKNDPRYCRYHQFVGHPSPACQFLRRILHEKINNGTLELPSKKQVIDDDPLPKRRGKEVCVITADGDHMMEEDHVPYQNSICQYQVSHGINPASWSRYSKPHGYDTPWSHLNVLRDNLVPPTFARQHLGASTKLADQVCQYSEASKLCYRGETSQAYRVTEVDEHLHSTAAQELQRNPKFKSLFGQLEYGPQARQAAVEALIRISKEYGPQCFITEVERTMSMLESDNAIIFTDTDMAVSFPDHRRPLYVEAQINDVFVRRALVDTGSSLNIIPLYVLKAARIPQSRIVKSEMKISGFAEADEVSIGYIQLDLRVGPIRSWTKFQVLDVNTSYHALLGRPWLNKHKLVPSTYHQCVKGRVGLKAIRIPGNQLPFYQSEAHYIEAQYYNEFTSDGGITPSEVSGVPLPIWHDIRDLSDEDFPMMSKRAKTQNNESSAYAQVPPRCSRVVMTDGRTIYRL
ncbi:hypothetical protein M0R45_019524 [Rubus argutus]|uniref:Retrotransposon gag domain-containing protein n=1 Tax=Rubus argutus TaxID=59490 RepID=A0AAW1X8D2_RUBAR